MKNRSDLTFSLMRINKISAERRKVCYLCREKVAGNILDTFKGPNVGWDVPLLLKKLWDNNGAFLGRDLSCCLLCSFTVAQYCIYFYTNANNHFSSPFFRHHFSGPWLSHLLLEGPPEAKSSPLHRFQHPAYHIQTQNILGCPLHQHQGYLLVDQKPARTIQHSQRSSPKVERRMLRLKWQNSP